MTLHHEIAGIAKENSAIYVGKQTVENLSLVAIRDQISRLVGNRIKVVSDNFYSTLRSANTILGGAIKDLDYKFHLQGTTVYLSAVGGLKLTVEYGCVDEQTQADVKLGEIEMIVKEMSIKIDISPSTLVCNPSTATFIPSINREGNFDDILDNANVDRDLAVRVEGTLAYSSIQTMIASMLRDTYAISFISLFPGIVLKGNLNIHVIGAQSTILIVPSAGIARAPGSVCECADVGDGIGENKPGSTNVTSNDLGNVGTIEIGGPTAPNPSSVPLGRRSRGIGDTGFYFPNLVAKKIVEGPFPLVRVDLSQGGTLKWNAHGVVDFKYNANWFDDALGATLVRLMSFPGDTTFAGNLEVDLGKLGTYKASEFVAHQQPGPCEIKIALYPVLRDGTIVFKPVVQSIAIADFYVQITFMSIWASYFGPLGSIIGFIVDMIIGRMVAHNIPIELRRALNNYMSNAAWKIMDVSYWEKLSQQSKRYTPNPVVLTDVLPDSMLISAKFDD
ncbi:hypothetical protein KHC28_01275 [Ancylobacter sonchi]|uniref:hypothetical protein n=1 Tax=Ancylobacter sonchi TaxID=1937790 RepID=UPI001BD3F997|nr:hypothetical protein [Ancylobacter sonchi]MBS7532284.1 hypothetical protein [Ancylobacter sonchi]